MGFQEFDQIVKRKPPAVPFANRTFRVDVIMYELRRPLKRQFGRGVIVLKKTQACELQDPKVGSSIIIAAPFAGRTLKYDGREVVIVTPSSVFLLYLSSCSECSKFSEAT